jgi:ribosome-associated protein
MKTAIDLLINEVNERKGEDVLYVHIASNQHPIADNIIVVSALNDIHLKSLVDGLIRFYKDRKNDAFKELDYFGVSGKPESKWVILDFNNLLIHVMDKDIRSSYDIDKLFADYENYRYH